MAAASELGADIPELVHLLPSGALKTQDGRSGFAWDGKAVRLCSWDGCDLVTKAPVDVNHANSKMGPAGGDTPAHGWIVELVVKDDGLWGRIDWNASGKALLANRSYRSISPELMVNAKTGLIEGIRGASLTNFPNLKGLVPILNSSEEQEHDNTMDKFLALLCAALTLKADAGEDGVITAVKALVTGAVAQKARLMAVAKAAGAAETADYTAVLSAVTALNDPAKMVPASAVAELRAELHTMTAQLNGIRESGAKARAEAFIDAEIKKGRMGVKPLREHYIARHMSSAAEASNVEKEISGQAVLTGGSVIDPATVPKAGDVSLSETDRLVAKQMGISEDAFKKTRAAEAAQADAA